MPRSSWLWMIVAFVLLWVIAISLIAIFENIDGAKKIEVAPQTSTPAPTTGNLDWPCPPGKDCKG